MKPFDPWQRKRPFDVPRGEPDFSKRLRPMWPDRGEPFGRDDMMRMPPGEPPGFRRPGVPRDLPPPPPPFGYRDRGYAGSPRDADYFRGPPLREREFPPLPPRDSPRFLPPPLPFDGPPRFQRSPPPPFAMQRGIPPPNFAPGPPGPPRPFFRGPFREEMHTYRSDGFGRAPFEGVSRPFLMRSPMSRGNPLGARPVGFRPPVLALARATGAAGAAGFLGSPGESGRHPDETSPAAATGWRSRIRRPPMQLQGRVSTSSAPSAFETAVVGESDNCSDSMHSTTMDGAKGDQERSHSTEPTDENGAPTENVQYEAPRELTDLRIREMVQRRLSQLEYQTKLVFLTKSMRVISLGKITDIPPLPEIQSATTSPRVRTQTELAPEFPTETSMEAEKPNETENEATFLASLQHPDTINVSSVTETRTSPRPIATPIGTPRVPVESVPAITSLTSVQSCAVTKEVAKIAAAAAVCSDGDIDMESVSSCNDSLERASSVGERTPRGSGPPPAIERGPPPPPPPWRGGGYREREDDYSVEYSRRAPPPPSQYRQPLPSYNSYPPQTLPPRRGYGPPGPSIPPGPPGPPHAYRDGPRDGHWDERRDDYRREFRGDYRDDYREPPPQRFYDSRGPPLRGPPPPPPPSPAYPSFFEGPPLPPPREGVVPNYICRPKR